MFVCLNPEGVAVAEPLTHFQESFSLFWLPFPLLVITKTCPFTFTFPLVKTPKPIILAIKMVDMEPIPLRSLTVVLKYELMTCDPRFDGMRLSKASAADPTLLATIKNLKLYLFEKLPGSIQ